MTFSLKKLAVFQTNLFLILNMQMTSEVDRLYKRYKLELVTVAD